MVNYGIVYGLSAFWPGRSARHPQDEAQEFIDRYLGGSRPSSASSTRRSSRRGRNGYVTTLFGRIRRIPELRAGSVERGYLGERLAVNMVIQGTAADIIKVAMVAPRLAARGRPRPGWSPDPRRAAIRGGGEGPATWSAAMAGAFDLDPALGVDVGVGGNWLEAK